MYNSVDTVRRDLAQAFASDALAVGIEVDLEALSWDRIDPRINQDSTLLGGGDEPFDPDTQAYDALNSKYIAPGVGQHLRQRQRLLQSSSRRRPGSRTPQPGSGNA